MVREKSTKKTADSPQSFEERLARLQEIVSSLEAANQPLDTGLALYKEGMALSQSCRTQLEQARNEIRVVTAQGLENFTQEEDETL